MIDYIAQRGVTSVTLSVHHDWQKIRDYFDRHPASLPLDYAVEQAPLGTGGAIAYALAEHPEKNPVIVLNGDSFIPVDYRALYWQHQNNKTDLTIALRKVPDTGRYGKVIEKNGIITSFAAGEEGKSGLINAGIYVLRPDLFAKNSMPQVFSFERDFLPQHLAKLKPRSFLAEDYFIDIGIPADYDRACRELPEIFTKRSQA